MRRLFEELRRREVHKVAGAYLVAAFVVVQVADLAGGAFGLPGWVEPLVWILCGVGLPVALGLAWVFDLTPGGIRRTPEVAGAEVGAAAPGEADDRPPPTLGLRTAAAAFLALGAMVVVAVGAWRVLDGTDGAPDRSIAVLPFRAIGGGQSDQLAAGFHDDLLTRLSGVSDLRVISRTSVERYRETSMSVPEIARELGVGWIVEGGVQQAGATVRVNAQLIRAAADDHQWARTFERELTAENLFDIQSELTSQVTSSLQAELSTRERERIARQPTADLEAYRLYVEGRTHIERRTEPGLRRGLELFEQAIARDSTYALAWSGLADARMLLVSFGHEPGDSLYPLAAGAARRALELDPDLAEAHASLGQLNADYESDVPAAIRHLQRAVELNPSYARAIAWLAGLQGAAGRVQPAVESMERAVELDPRSALSQLLLGWTYWWAEGPSQRALDHVRLAGELEPAFSFAHIDAGLILVDQGRPDEALPSLERGLALEAPGTFAWMIGTAGLGWTHAERGDTAAARATLARLGGDAPFGEAMIHAALGDDEATVDALGRVEWTPVLLWDLRGLPMFDRLRDDPRFQEILRAAERAMGLGPEDAAPGR